MNSLELYKDIPFNNSWQNIRMSETHKREFKVECILNSQLAEYGFKSFRCQGGPFSAFDIEIVEYDYNNLVKGKLVCKVDVECKEKVKFPDMGIPKNWFRVSFLSRKLQKMDINFDRDVYLLIDNQKQYPKVIWAPYGTIREFGVRDIRPGYKNDFYAVLPEHYDKLYYTYRDLVNWCNKLKNAEIIA